MPIPPRHPNADAKQRSQSFDLKDFFLPPIGHDFAPAHQYHALDVRDDVSQFMRDQQDRRPSSGQRAHRLPHYLLGCQVERIAGFVE